MHTLVIADHDNSKLNAATLNTIKAASNISETITLLVAGYNCSTVALAASEIPCLTKVLHADAEHYEHFLAEELAPLVIDQVGSFSHILAPATTFGKNLMPRIAAMLGVSAISDVLEIISVDTFVRPVYAGSALATVQSSEEIKIITIRSTSFDMADNEGGSVPIEVISPSNRAGLSTFNSRDLTESGRPDLTTAKIVISGGRGVGSEENFEIIYALADAIGAGVGASRAAVDAGYVPNDYQIGQTGKIVAPELYIAVGISGAIQHLAGMKDSKIIVAINKDEEAPIFEISDYGLVADLFEVVPELTEQFSK